MTKRRTSRRTTESRKAKAPWPVIGAEIVGPLRDRLEQEYANRRAMGQKISRSHIIREALLKRYEA